MKVRTERQPLLGAARAPQSGLGALLRRLIAAVCSAFKKYFRCFKTAMNQAKSLEGHSVKVLNSEGYIVPKDQPKKPAFRVTSVQQALQARDGEEDLLILDESPNASEDESADEVEGNSMPMAFSATGKLVRVKDLSEIFPGYGFRPVVSGFRPVVSAEPAHKPYKARFSYCKNWFRSEID